ncbi:putative Zinc resistance-associated protein [uncultured Gammaproteobacteria bacterium]
MSEWVRNNRWVSVALVVSVCCNLIFVGALSARWLMGPPFGRFPPPPPHHALGGFVEHLARGLPDADGQVLRLTFSAQRDEIVAASRAGEDARAEVAKVLAREPFDPARLSHAFDRVSVANRALEDRLQTLVFAVLNALSPDGRRMLIRSLPPPP